MTRPRDPFWARSSPNFGFEQVKNRDHKCSSVATNLRVTSGHLERKKSRTLESVVVFLTFVWIAGFAELNFWLWELCHASAINPHFTWYSNFQYFSFFEFLSFLEFLFSSDFVLFCLTKQFNLPCHQTSTFRCARDRRPHELDHKKTI